MQKFTVLKATSAALPLPNIDTDTIIPARYLKTIKRTGLGKAAFYPMRYDDKGQEKRDFVLNREPFRQAKILVAGDNFGCGSSREHAPWAISDFGISCLIATSFADIFFNNCAKNGILCITLPKADVDALMKDAQQGAILTVDLAAQTITRPGGAAIRFEVDAHRKHNLLHGLDDVGITLQAEKSISAYEARSKTERPWV
ncbi:MAG: 3-isopropylmalate dehydratase small subunit [Alphaproteobacteria bacterium]|nr:3-isopropylmalate dehydratase small subunit [Alphaproteobacteria bacterium]